MSTGSVASSATLSWLIFGATAQPELFPGLPSMALSTPKLFCENVATAFVNLTGCDLPSGSKSLANTSLTTKLPLSARPAPLSLTLTLVNRTPVRRFNPARPTIV